MNDSLDLFFLLYLAGYLGFVLGLFFVEWANGFVNIVREVFLRIKNRKSAK